MAWNPNEKGNYAWLTKQASEHGGANQFIASIEENAATQQRDKDMKLLCAVVTLTATVATAGTSAYYKIKQKLDERRKVKEREAEEAKEIIRKNVKIER